MPITNRSQNLILLLAAEKQYPPNVLWSLNHSLAFPAGAAAGPSVIGQSCCAHPLLLCREVWLRKPKLGWRWVGWRGASTQEPDSQIFCHWYCHLNLLVHWREAFFVGRGVVFNLSSYNGLHGNKNKLGWGETHSCSFLSEFTHLILFCVGAAAQTRRAQVSPMTGREQGGMTCSLYLSCIPSVLQPLACSPHCVSLL